MLFSALDSKFAEYSGQHELGLIAASLLRRFDSHVFENSSPAHDERTSRLPSRSAVGVGFGLFP